jgi:hypothetical protein
MKHRFFFLFNDVLLLTKKEGSRRYWLKVYVSLRTSLRVEDVHDTASAYRGVHYKPSTLCLLTQPNPNTTPSPSTIHHYMHMHTHTHTHSLSSVSLCLSLAQRYQMNSVCMLPKRPSSSLPGPKKPRLDGCKTFVRPSMESLAAETTPTPTDSAVAAVAARQHLTNHRHTTQCNLRQLVRHKHPLAHTTHIPLLPTLLPSSQSSSPRSSVVQSAASISLASSHATATTWSVMTSRKRRSLHRSLPLHLATLRRPSPPQRTRSLRLRIARAPQAAALLRPKHPQSQPTPPTTATRLLSSHNAPVLHHQQYVATTISNHGAAADHVSPTARHIDQRSLMKHASLSLPAVHLFDPVCYTVRHKFIRFRCAASQAPATSTYGIRCASRAFGTANECAAATHSRHAAATHLVLDPVAAHLLGVRNFGTAEHIVG